MQKKGAQSWMFKRDAEEHYFGSIVEHKGSQLLDSLIGSILAKASKRETVM